MAEKSTYRKGYLKELEVVRRLKRAGYPVVFRTSHKSPFDVIALSRYRVLLVQVKTGAFNMKKELEKLSAIETPKYVSKELWVLNKEWRRIKCEKKSKKEESLKVDKKIAQ